MIICSVSLAVIFLIMFIISAKSGQFEDDESPAVRILLEDQNSQKDTDENQKKETDKKTEKENKVIS